MKLVRSAATAMNSLGRADGLEPGGMMFADRLVMAQPVQP